MLSRRASRIVVPLALLIMAGTIPGLNGWMRSGLARPASPQSDPRQPPAAATQPDANRPGQSDDEKAIRAVDDAFVAAYNRGESKALALRFTEDAEVVEADGERFQGRGPIESRFADTFAAGPGVKISIEIASIRFLSPDVAKEEGRTLIAPAKGPALARTYTALFVKRDGRWLISSVREESAAAIGPHDRLKDLEWMIGEWVDEGSDSVVRVNCQWSEGKNFLVRSFTIKFQGKPVMTISQRIGWDPLARRIRSWEFDSEGGFGEGQWSRDGERWVIKHTGVRPDGTPTSATNLMMRERSDLVRWTSTDRVLGEESVPDDEAYVMVRVPPPPRLRSSGQATPIPSPNTTRSPR